LIKPSRSQNPPKHRRRAPELRTFQNSEPPRIQEESSPRMQNQSTERRAVPERYIVMATPPFERRLA